ncbi:hypothetical protein AB0B89_18495 [Sphaerisporangium sp. NPDC049002]|uniref:hypothetical protein n=1 Tax=unclassified Sphaerisporangium TaxID=2630420 RepID=UPI0033EEB325
MTENNCWLVLGGLHVLNGTAPLRADEPLILIPLELRAPGNTLVLRWSDLGPVELIAGDRRVTSEGVALFPGMRPSQEVRSLLGDGPIVPLFCLSDTGDGLHVYSQIRFLEEDACFIRITSSPLAEPADSLRWLPEAARLHSEQALFLNNHQRYYRKCFVGQELEYKYTLTPPVDIWTANLDLYRSLLAGDLPGYVMEYRDEFQAWDYLNHLYEITAPAAELGYVSFIPTTDGKHLVKRKWYAEDSFERRESHTYGVEVEQFGDYITDVLGLEAVRLPSFRRVRYDVNFESVTTGHVYGIFFDHCSLLDAPDVVLHQCELEYLRSRTAIAADEAAVLDEMAEIAQWLEGFLRARGLNDQRGFYSKRTFLKDSVSARPELALVVR